MNLSSPSDWSLLRIPEALDEKEPIIRPSVKIAARDYLQSGDIPIYDQSQNGIAGWTDNESAVLRPCRSVVVFGDHTRAFKYVDTPFAAGADGTLILNPSVEFNPRFFFFACLGLEIPSRGYNRHYKLLKEMVVPKPPIGEQRKIAAILDKMQAAVEVEGNLVELTRELKRTALNSLFTRGLRREPQRETRFGPVPESWKEEPLSDRAFVQTGIAKNTKTFRQGDIELPYLRVANVQDGRIDLTEIKNIRVPAKDVESSLLRTGDVVLTEGGDFDKLGRGFIWEGQIDQCVHQNHIFAVRTSDIDRLDPRFFAYLAQSPYGKAYFLTVAHKTTNLACINATKLRAFPVLLPEPSEQREIAALLGTIDTKLAHHEARQKLLRELFRTLLHDLLAARRRVTSIALSDFLPDVGKVIPAAES
jgi:restriction endonuclease S subunit